MDGHSIDSEDDFTLPDLQARLNSLDSGEGWPVSSADCDRLFGIKDAGAGRMRSFARLHGCILVHDARGVVF